MTILRALSLVVVVELAVVPIASAQGQVKQASASKVNVADATLRDVRTTGQRLLDQSRNSFERGLMPLPDYLEQMSSATELNVRLAGAANQSTTQREWLSSQVRQLESAAKRLDGFRQPASMGWQSDVLLAKFSLASAQAKLATFDGLSEQAAAAKTRASDFARKHWEKRLDDATIGHASPMETWRAVSLLNQSEGRSLGANRASLLAAVDVAKRSNAVGAGIGRDDLRDALQFELARVDLQESQPGSESFSKNAEQAESLLVKLHESTTKYHARGTASLYDVAMTWRKRSELHTYLQSQGDDSVPKGWQQRRDSDLQSLQGLAAKTTDRRGRNAADTTYVELLSLVEKTANVR